MARKPLSEPTVAANVLEHGTGAINVDGCRIETTDKLGGGAEKRVAIEGKHEGWARPWMHDSDAVEAHAARVRANVEKAESLGRWPANVALDEQAAQLLDQMSGESKSPIAVTRGAGRQMAFGMNRQDDVPCYGDTGGASRFYYTSKASTAERRGSKHPTVKPLDLMCWLVRMVTPPGGTVLDPFAGSGTTLEAAITEGFHAIGIEQQAEYLADIENRLSVVAVRLPLDFGGST